MTERDINLILLAALIIFGAGVYAGTTIPKKDLPKTMPTGWLSAPPLIPKGKFFSTQPIYAGNSIR